MLIRRSAARLFALAAAAGLPAAAAVAQTPNCATVVSSSSTTLPHFSGTLPGSADMSVGGGSYIYILTQWGMTRGSLSDPLHPSAFTQVVIGKEGGSGNGGLITILCDCHQGGNNMDVAEGTGGTSRLISDWQPFKQGHGDSGLAAQVAQTAGAGGVTFGDQIDLDSDVPLGARSAAIYLPSSGKYFGYFPTSGNNVQKVDLTTVDGNPDTTQALPPTAGINWSSLDNSTNPPSVVGVRLRAVHVTTSTYDEYILVGATKGVTSQFHVAEITQSNGALSEVASGNIQNFPIQFDVGVVNDRIFIVSAEGGSGLDVYEFVPATNSIVHVNEISGTYYRAILRGPQPFPALFLHRSVGGNESYIDIYDTKWFTQGGSPLLAKSLRHFGAPGIPYKGYGIEALVRQEGSNLMAYLYRELGGYPDPGLHTDQINISCIAADPNAPPIPFASLTNLSSAARGDGINYYGDKWSLTDTSVSYSPITELDWDFHYTGSFAAEKIQTGANLGGTSFNPAYWPCDDLNGGDVTTGAGCYQSLGTPAATYQLGLQAKNVNGPGAAPFVSSPPLAVAAPQLSLVGYNGNTLQVLAGNANNGDARGSQGNTADASFVWSFTPSGNATGTLVTVPTSATAFILTATYKGGYSTSKSGTVSQVDLVPNFSLTPNPVIKGGTLTLKNLMQIASAATLNTVTYDIAPGGPTGVSLPAAFNVVNGTASVTAPAAAGSYTITLTYSYLDHTLQVRTAQVALPFSAIDFVPAPALGVYTDAGHSHPVFPVGSPLTWNLQQGSTYYLFDDETLPAGTPHPGAGFYKSGDQQQSIGAGDSPLTGSPTSGNGPATFAASATCASSCYFKIEVPANDGAVRAFRYTVQGGGGGGGCAPNCPTNPTVGLAAPSPASPKVGDVITFTALPTGFTTTPSYSWDFGDGTGGGGSGGGGGGGGSCPPVIPGCSTMAVTAFSAGPNPNTHSYTAAGTYTVTVQATGGGGTASASQSVTVADAGPPPAPSSGFLISGASLGAGNRFEAMLGQVVTFTAVESHATNWVWDFGDGSTAQGKVVTHAYSQLSSPNATLTVTGDGTNTTGISSAAIPFRILDPGVLLLGNGRYAIRATWSSSGQGTSGAGTAVTLTGDTGYFWFFSAANIEVIAKVLDACSVDGHIWVFAGGLTALHVQLTVTDTVTGTTKTYDSPEGPFDPIQDTHFETCGTSGAAVAPAATTATSVALSPPTPSAPIAGDSVSFTATATGFTGTVTYNWDFGDSCPPVVPGCTGGAVAGPATNTHVYQGAGTYTVTVQATAPGGQSALASQTVTVSPVSTTPRPSVGFTISGAPLGAGGRYQAQINTPVTLTATETHGTYLWDFGNGDTSTDQTVTHTFTAAGSPSVTLTVTGDGTNTAGTSSVTIRFTVTDPFTLYLDGGRFAVKAHWSTQGSSGDAKQVSLTNDTGYFWFFSASNTEVVVKVLDACSVDGHFWVFASGLTNLGVTLTVTDTQKGTTMTYTNNDGTPFAPIGDFSSFVACN